MKNTSKPFYGKRTKKKIVEEYLNTSASMDELAKLHGILGCYPPSPRTNRSGPHMSCHDLTPNKMHLQRELPVITWKEKEKNE